MLNVQPPQLPDHLPEDTLFGGFTQRLGAYVIDLLVLAPLAFLAYHFTVDVPNIYIVMAVALVDALYKPILEKVYGFTVGKKIMKLRVVSQADLGPISWNQTFIRFIPWAIVSYVGVFTTIRHFQDPNFGDFATYQEYFDYVRESTLGQSSILSFLNNVPVFSAIFIIGDVTARALHDRWAKTYVIATAPSFLNKR